MLYTHKPRPHTVRNANHVHKEQQERQGFNQKIAVLLTNGQGGVTALGGGPWWAYLGGLCGAVLVTATLVATPRLGVTSTFVAVIVGQVAVAAVIDRFGLFGVAARGLTPTRVAAIGLLAVSLVLLLRN